MGVDRTNLKPWSKATRPDDIKPGAVHVWQTSWDIESKPVGRFQDLLPPEEQARSVRYCFKEDRYRYIVGRGMLRTILAHFLRCRPLEVRFKYLENGKPVLSDDLAEMSGLSFNLAHSRQVVVCAVTRSLPVGVDVEYMREHIDQEAIARRFFSADETAALFAAPDMHRLALFYRFWACKEAYIKATGQGLSQLGDVEIVLSSAHSMTFASLPGWSLYEFCPSSGYAAAVAVQGQGHSICHWHYPIPISWH